MGYQATANWVNSQPSHAQPAVVDESPSPLPEFNCDNDFSLDPKPRHGSSSTMEAETGSLNGEDAILNSDEEGVGAHGCEQSGSDEKLYQDVDLTDPEVGVPTIACPSLIL